MSDQGLTAQTLCLYAFQKRQKNIAKKLDKNGGNKYINKAPEEKRFTEKRAEPRKKNSLKA